MEDVFTVFFICKCMGNGYVWVLAEGVRYLRKNHSGHPGLFHPIIFVIIFIYTFQNSFISKLSFLSSTGIGLTKSTRNSKTQNFTNENPFTKISVLDPLLG